MVEKTRLTENQITVLCSASASVPIYAETPKFLHAQMPGGRLCFALRTVKSLADRGYLKQDGSSGYLLTPEGTAALKSGMGF